MTKQINALFDALDLQLCEKAYNELERSQPNIVQTIEAMIKRGVKPVEIRSHVMARFPNRWLEGQTLEQAARYCEHLKESE